MRGILTALGATAAVCGIVPVAVGTAGIVLPAVTAGATNTYGPGLGIQTQGKHWGGAYVLQGVSGYAYCISPGHADPIELPSTQWEPVPYPAGGNVFSSGQMAALTYFAQVYEGPGFPGYSVDQTVAAIAEVAYASAGGVSPPTSRAPTWLVDDLEAWMTTYAGPWQISLTMNPPSGSTFQPQTNYSGTVTVTSAAGDGVGGLELTPPAVGGPATGEVSNFVWDSPTTDAAGQIGFQWNIAGAPPGGGHFSAGGMTVVGGAPGAAPLTYAAPNGSGGQEMVVAGATETLTTGFSGTVEPPPELGELSIEKTVPDAPYYGPGGAVFQVIDGSGAVADTLTTGPTGATPSVTVPTAPTGTAYRVHEIHAPPGYGLAADQVVTVHPSQNTVVSFSGADEEPVLAAQLGAAKVDAQTGQPLAGASFDFRFDQQDDGAYDENLGSCTTGASGTCQPPIENAAGGWLPGWYQVTETAAPPGYWLDPATAVREVFLDPGATDVATVTFADDLLGSLQLTKTGNDTAYLPVTGAVFTVTGPAPSATDAGTLTVGTGGTTDTLTGLTPGTYTMTETTAPPGYTVVPPFTVAVTAGRTTTTVTATDPVRPGQLLVSKVDQATGAPLAGATFDTRYDSRDDGTFDVDLGTCTTDAAGTCSPPPDDGTGLLPGTYQVTETSAPPGYSLPLPAPSQIVTVPASATATVTFADALLVPASFTKIATGNVDPAELDLAGAVLDVTAGTSTGGPVLATCTTDGTGQCTTAPALVSGQPYCWQEVAAPAGLAAGAAGCFTATNAQADEPITVDDPGEFVAVRAEKVDATSPGTPVAGATFDLYRVDGGDGPPSPPSPADAAVVPGQTWVARAATGADGEATFPLQLPGYAYCTLEEAAPPGYAPDTAERCTGVLQGSTAVPAAVTTLVTADAEAHVTVSARKFNAATPDTGIPGAVYDLYVEGHGAPSGPPSTAPTNAAPVPGDTWWARGTTDATGMLQFTVPAGYAWCLKEVSAPADYVRDDGLHCTGILTTTTPAPALRIALPETLASVELYTRKYDALSPHTEVPGATYELVGEGSPPPGWSPADPDGEPVPPGDWYVGTATTGADGVASWTVPAGYAWCVHEVSAPTGYLLDAGWHCTGVVTTSTAPQAATVSLPEVPSPPELPFTGGPPRWLYGSGAGLLGLGGALVLAGRRRPDRRTE